MMASRWEKLMMMKVSVRVPSMMGDPRKEGATLAEKTGCRGIFRLRFRRTRLGSPLQHCPDPAHPRHPPASEGAHPRTVASPLGAHSVMGERLVCRRQDD